MFALTIKGFFLDYSNHSSRFSSLTGARSLRNQTLLVGVIFHGYGAGSKDTRNSDLHISLSPTGE